MTNYESKKDGKLFTLVGAANPEGKVTLKGDEGTIIVSESTLKRWYKPTDKQIAVEETKKETKVATLERPNVKVVEGIKMDPQEFKGEVSKKPTADKQLKKAEAATRKADCGVANEALVNRLLQYGQKKGCDIIAHDVDIVLRFNGRNILKAVVGKTTATMFFNFDSVPEDYFTKNNLECVPKDWKWALEIKVKVSEANQKTILDLIDFGVKYIETKTKEKEAKKVEKKTTKATSK